MALSAPSPATTATDVAANATLSWTDSVSSDSYTVYFGTNSTDVTAKASSTNRGSVLTAAYDPRVLLTNGTVYYWRIVALVGVTETDSAVFSFTVIAAGAGVTAKK